MLVTTLILISGHWHQHMHGFGNYAWNYSLLEFALNYMLSLSSSYRRVSIIRYFKHKNWYIFRCFWFKYCTCTCHYVCNLYLEWVTVLLCQLPRRFALRMRRRWTLILGIEPCLDWPVAVNCLTTFCVFKILVDVSIMLW